MRLLLSIFTIVSIAVLSISCNIASHKYFTTYKRRPFDSIGLMLKMNGVYFITDFKQRGEKSAALIFLYADGSASICNCSGMSDVPEEKFWANPEHYLQNLHFNRIGLGGQYIVRDNKITIQRFETNPGHFFAINSLEMNGIIKNDSSIVITGGFCGWCGDSNSSEDNLKYDSIKYKFVQTAIRPDSSKLWFKTRSWYKKEVWFNND